MLEEVETSKKKIVSLKTEIEGLKISSGKEDSLESEYLAAVEDIKKLKAQTFELKSELAKRDKNEAEADNALLLELEKERQRSSLLMVERAEHRTAAQNYKS